MKYPLVRKWMIDHTGLEPSLLDGPSFDLLVSQRMASRRAVNETLYAAMLEVSPDEVDQIAAGVAVPETWLFRYPRSFDLLVEFLQQRLAATGAEDRTLRMCSIGCATGQEPYSMAMCALHAGWPARQLQILGLDRNQEFLRAARAAEYGTASVRTELPTWAMQYLRNNEEFMTIDPVVKGIVKFLRADAAKPNELETLPQFDVIFCRNVLIYLCDSTRDRLLETIVNLLAPGGLLFVGHAEQMMRPTRRSSTLRPTSIPHAFALERVDSSSPPKVQAPEIILSPAKPPTAVKRSIKRVNETPPPRASAASASPPAEQAAREETLEDARALADAGRTHEVEPLVRAIIARRGPSAPAFELLGMIRMTQSDFDGAKRLFEQAVYLEPARSTSLLQLALISEKAGDISRARMLWDRAKRASSSGVERETRR